MIAKMMIYSGRKYKKKGGWEGAAGREKKRRIYKAHENNASEKKQ